MPVHALLTRAEASLPEGARAENGVTAVDVREYLRYGEWELALDLLQELGEDCPVPCLFWKL